MARLLSIVAVALMGACCSAMPTCGTKPRKPAQIRTVSLFGPVSSDPTEWILGRSGTGRLRIASRSYAVDSDTQRLGSCSGVSVNSCFVYAGVAGSGALAWVLLAQPSVVDKTTPPAQRRLTVTDVMVWKVRTATLVLSEGIELPFGAVFADKLASSRESGFRQALEGRQVATTLYVDGRTGVVFDATFGGCA